MKDERLVSKMEAKTNFSRRFKTVSWLDLTDPDPLILRQIHSTAADCHECPSQRQQNGNKLAGPGRFTRCSDEQGWPFDYSGWL